MTLRKRHNVTNLGLHIAVIIKRLNMNKGLHIILVTSARLFKQVSDNVKNTELDTNPDV